jgi:competence protein ComEA
MDRMERTETMRHPYRFASRFVLAAVLLTAALPALAAEGKNDGKTEGKKGSVVNVNAADAAQLALLPRVGPSVAQRIVDYRKKNGPFKSTDDLMLVQGIGEKTYALIKPYVSTGGETTLKEKVKAGKAGGGKESKESKEGAR